MSKDFTGPLSLDNLGYQFCSDWLKGEIKRVLEENLKLRENNKVLKKELTVIADQVSNSLLLDELLADDWDALHEAIKRADEIIDSV